jgi:hypothetical protein
MSTIWLKNQMPRTFTGTFGPIGPGVVITAPLSVRDGGGSSVAHDGRRCSTPVLPDALRASPNGGSATVPRCEALPPTHMPRW